jgi:hypothetical protein
MEPGASTGTAAAAGPPVAGPSVAGSSTSANLNNLELIDLTHDASDGEHQHAHNGADCENQHCIQVQKSYRRQLNVQVQEITALGNTHKLEVAKKDQQLTASRSKARKLEKEKKELEARISVLEKKLKGRQHTERTWPAEMQAFIANVIANGGKGASRGYHDLYKLW